MKLKFLLGFEYWLVGFFWSRENRAWYFFPLPLFGFKISLSSAPNPRRRVVDKPIEPMVKCSECGHCTSDHHAASSGFHRGAMNEVVQDIKWTCTHIDGCSCSEFKPERV